MYHDVVTRLTDEGRLKFDAALGDERAIAELETQRAESVVDAGFEVG